MFDLSPLLLWSEEKLCSWAVSPCFRNTQQRRAWRELAKGNNTNIDMLIFLYIHIDINKTMQIYDNVEIKQYSNTSIHQYVYIDTTPFAKFSSCTAKAVYSAKHRETAQEQRCSSLQSSKGERSNILQGRCEQHPILRMLHTFRAAIRK